MSWNQRVIICCSSLVLFGFVGCAKHVRIKIDPSLRPITAMASPGDTLQWAAATPSESFAVHWQQGLCQQGTPDPIPASYGKPAGCIVGPQNFQPADTAIEYTYTLEGNGGREAARAPGAGGGNPPTVYTVAIGPRHCPSCLNKLPTNPPPPPHPPQPPQ
jgi:hypothetical protein